MRDTPTADGRPAASDATLLLCFSHLRWNFVYQRPQHLLGRAAKHFQVLFLEEPVAREGATPMLELHPLPNGVTVAVPVLPPGLDGHAAAAAQRQLLDDWLAPQRGRPRVLWYYTPMALAFTDHLSADLTVYDSMDELSAFRGAPPRLLELERELFRRADLVFTGGPSLYEAKRHRHASVHCFPSSIDAHHFRQARDGGTAPAEDQLAIPGRKLGFFGVIDERMDTDLVAAVADLRPDWQIVMVGPVVKIDPASLPRRPNIHWLGGRSYDQLPAYLSGWDVGLMPFALNEATRFISPTKTPEFLAAGVPVVSTPITDVVRPYGEAGLVEIAATAEEMVERAETLLARPRGPWLAQVDAFLSGISWDKTWDGMHGLMRERLAPRPALPGPRPGIGAFDWLVVGAGFAGSVLAERIARERGEKVLVVDRRPHVAGNAYDKHDAAGVLMHQYGPHIFHTNSQAVFDYLSRFTRWRPYEHRVLASVDGMLLPIPINLDTVNRLYGLDLTSDQLEDFFAARAETVAEVRTSEDVVVGRVGRDLYEKFFRGYTRKQWGVDPSELDKSVTARVPTRTNRDDRYFTDSQQYMPAEGYTRMFERMLDHPNIKVMLQTDYREIRDMVPHNRLVFTGPVDEYFDFRFGKLPYRSLRFEHVTMDTEWHQPVGVVNFPQDQDYTRVTEYKHLTGQSHPRTSLTYEYPSDAGDPYYPVPRPENAALYKQYEALADATPDVWFVGRLATYRYYNMDQVVAQALSTFARIQEALPLDTTPKPTGVPKLAAALKSIPLPAAAPARRPAAKPAKAPLRTAAGK